MAESKQAEKTTETTAEKKKQKASVSYALKALGKHIETLEEGGLIEKGDADKMKEIKVKAVTKYIETHF